ncbi:MAG TPA: glycosyltransferase family 2 protein [Acidobacteriota bacterium]|nr:glycosyltransferase family 2 protein [Acidobacteriota bacterium]
MSPQAVVNENEWRVLALRRSGHHAVIHWIIRQCQGPGLFLNDCRLTSDRRLLGNRFSRYFNMDPRQAERDLAGLELAPKQLYIYNLEDLSGEDFQKLTEAARPRGGSRRLMDIAVVRDPFNWAASRQQAEPQLDLAGEGLIERWKNHLRLARRRQDEDDFLVIYFSRWVCERDYRRQICRRLDIPFTDSGFQEVELPGISSFDASQVALDNQIVLQRWKKRVWDERYRQWMADEELLELASEAGARDTLRLFRAAARPAISVVLPTYNRADLIGETIESVRCQSRGDWELLVVDDGSEDETGQVVRSFPDPRIRYFPQQATRSISAPRNRGLRRARGRLIAMLDSDDLWEADKLEVQSEALGRHASAGWSWTGYMTFDSRGPLRHNHYPILESTHQPDLFVGDVLQLLLETRFVIYTSTLLISADLLRRTGPLNEELTWGDHDFIVRLGEHSPALVIKRQLARIRKHEGNTAGDSPVGFQEAIYSLRRARRRGKVAGVRYRTAMARLRLNFGASLMGRGHRWRGCRQILAAFGLQPRWSTLSMLWRGRRR